jgi:ATP-dependent protease ClpP protease subunit
MKWFRIENSTDQPTDVDIHIVDVIAGWDDDWLARNFGYDMGVTARAFVEALAKLDANVTTIRVHINSPGGDVFAAMNIANALREQQMSKGRTWRRSSTASPRARPRSS